MMKKIQKHLPEIIEIFKKHQVLLALLFGSAVNGRLNNLSDIDFAVFIRDFKDDAQLSLMSDLSMIFKKDVDVVILNKAGPLIAQMAITHGKILFCQDENLKIKIFTKTLQKFDDALYLARIFNHYLEKRVYADKMGERL